MSKQRSAPASAFSGTDLAAARRFLGGHRWHSPETEDEFWRELVEWASRGEGDFKFIQTGSELVIAIKFDDPTEGVHIWTTESARSFVMTAL